MGYGGSHGLPEEGALIVISVPLISGKRLDYKGFFILLLKLKFVVKATAT